MVYKKVSKLIGILLTAVSFIFLTNILIENINKISIEKYNLSSFYLFIFGIIIVIIGHMILAYSWYLLINKYNSNFKLKNSIMIISLSQLAKYIPGNIAHLVGRLLLASHWFKKTTILKTMIVESIILIFVASIFSFMWEGSYTYIKSIYLVGYSTYIFSFFVSIITLLYILRRRYSWSQIRIFIVIALMYSISFLLYGILIYLLFVHVFDVYSLSIWQCTITFAMAFLVGYILPGAPGGIGVREAIFILLFANSSITESIIFQVIIIIRIIAISGDLSLFIIANFYQKHIDTSVIPSH